MSADKSSVTVSHLDQTSVSKQQQKQQIWQKLEQASEQVPTLTELFAQMPNRGEIYHVSACGIYFDYSKQLIDQDILRKLLELAKVSELPKAIKAMMTGKRVNPTEGRAALHTALRLPANKQLMIDGTDIIAEVQRSLNKWFISPTGYVKGYGEVFQVKPSPM